MLLLKFALAFGSLSYELVLAQALSAFLDNTVFRYSSTIGLYLFSSGLGVWLAGRFLRRDRAWVLWRTEVLLTLSGAAGFAVLFGIAGLNIPAVTVVVAAYVLVALIGLLTGLELPLMLSLAALEGVPRGKILGADYAGACAATLAFVFVFYPWLGLVPSVILLVLINAVMSAVAAWRWRSSFGQRRGVILGVSVVMVMAALAGVLLCRPLETFWVNCYLGRVL
jgi:spermidine synthase